MASPGFTSLHLRGAVRLGPAQVPQRDSMSGAVELQELMPLTAEPSRASAQVKAALLNRV